MNRRTFLAASAAGALAQPTASKPNFLFILSDDHHYQALGASGNPHIRTPHLDRLAKRGVHFTNAIISTAQCAPSRGVLLSGLETFQSGLKSNGAKKFRADLGPTTIEQFRRAGYQTTLIGKWHIDNLPAECGFSDAPLWLRGGSSQYQDPELIRGLHGPRKKEPGHITDLFTTAATDFIRVAKKPFFLWLAYNAPHTPWFAAERYQQLYAGKSDADIAPPAHPPGGKPFQWKRYYEVITHLDEAVGRVISELETAGLWHNTIVVFLGDNGFLCGTKGLNGKVHPWEESVRVPMIAAGGPVKRGVSHPGPVASIDVAATWLDFAGIQPAYKLAGRTLKPLLATGKGAPDDAFAVWDDGRAEALAIRTVVEPYRLVRTRTHKLVVWESRKQALFDVVSDPGEANDLVGDIASAPVLDDLRGRLARRMKATGDHALAWLG